MAFFAILFFLWLALRGPAVIYLDKRKERGKTESDFEKTIKGLQGRRKRLE